MYIVAVCLLLFVLPAGSVVVVWTGSPNKILLIGKWFVFWAVGTRRRLSEPPAPFT